MTYNKIELIPVSLMKQNPSRVALIDEVAKELNLIIGWHYHLDIIWILNYIESQNLPRKATILDAGGGHGIIQFCLSRLGYNVISVDFLERKPKQKMSELYPMIQSDAMEEVHDHGYFKFKERPQNKTKPQKVVSNKNSEPLNDPRLNEEGYGVIDFHRADLRNLSAIQSGSVDAVVSVSVLEHNERDDILKIMQELERVTKVDGAMCITVSASGREDWFHEQSHGWCYSERSLCEIFFLHDAPPPSEFNYQRYNEYMDELRDSEDLKSKLHSAYFKSGDNGMPWGVWNPEYYPVGIVRYKK